MKIRKTLCEDSDEVEVQDDSLVEILTRTNVTSVMLHFKDGSWVEYAKEEEDA